MLVLALVLSPAAPARGPVEKAGPLDLKITVRVHDLAKVPNGAWTQARNVATQVLRHAGIEALWLYCPADSTKDAEISACEAPMGPQDLELRIIPQTATDIAGPDDVIGLALLNQGDFPTTAMIFFDRVERLSWEMLESSTGGIFVGAMWLNTWQGLTLGVAMTHEIGHLLLNSRDHAREGVMLPSWNREDLLRAAGGNSRFTAAEAGQLRNQVMERTRTAQGF
jgi:hypothetical protein